MSKIKCKIDLFRLKLDGQAHTRDETPPRRGCLALPSALSRPLARRTIPRSSECSCSGSPFPAFIICVGMCIWPGGWSCARACRVAAPARVARRAERALWPAQREILGIYRSLGSFSSGKRRRATRRDTRVTRPARCARDHDVHALRAWAFQNAQGYSFKAG